MLTEKFEIGDVVTLNTEELLSFSKKWGYDIGHYLPIWEEEGIIVMKEFGAFRIFFPYHLPPDYPINLSSGIYWNINPFYLKHKSKS